MPRESRPPAPGPLPGRRPKGHLHRVALLERGAQDVMRCYRGMLERRLRDQVVILGEPAAVAVQALARRARVEVDDLEPGALACFPVPADWVRTAWAAARHRGPELAAVDPRFFPVMVFCTDGCLVASFVKGN
jgi:hypothetical protein